MSDKSHLKEEALQMIQEGLTGREVSERTGVHQTTISQWRKAAGMSGKRGGRAKNQPHHSTKPHNPEVREEALRLFRDGVKLREIENQLGISYQTIYAWTRKSDQTTHSQSKSDIRVSKDKDSGMFHVIDKEGTMLGEYARRKTARAQATRISKRQTNKANISQGSTCRVCQIYLDENNSYTSMVSRGNLICKKCHQSQVRQRQNKASNTTKKHPLRYEAIQMIRDGVTGVEVAKRLGVHKDTVRKWRKSAGLSGQSSSKTNLKEEALQMIRDGVTGVEVAKRLGVHKDTVRKWRKSAGLSGTRKGPNHSLLKEEGLQMIRDGVTGVEVAKRLGVHKETVRKWRKSAGLSGTRGGPNHSLLKEEGLQMIRDGISGAEVARRLGVAKGTVSKWRKSAGLSGVDGRQFHDIEKENEVIDLLREDKSFNQIAKSTGVGRNAIIKIKTEAEKEGFL